MTPYTKAEIKECHREKIKTKLDTMVEDEWTVANQLFPQFASIHEGHSVLKEELEELMEEVENMHQCANYLWSYIRHQNNPNKQTYGPFELVDRIKQGALKAAEEAIQVAAMCEKFMVMKGDFENDRENA